MSVQASAQGERATKFEACVLLVEDDDELREGLAENLRLNGLKVTEADCGEAFHKAMRTGTFDVAILDVNLPDTNGFDLAASIARDGRQIGVIMLTARTGQADRIRGYAEGADLYVTKPVVGEELLLAVNNLIRRIQARHVAATTGDEAAWRLDVTLCRLVAPDGTAVGLSGRETMLLEQFAMADGAPIPRRVLADIMGYGAPGAQHRGLDAALRRLRLKLIDNGIELPVVGIQNIGVRFIAPLAAV
jgi:DNA-binding response OmpR family regulator